MGLLQQIAGIFGRDKGLSAPQFPQGMIIEPTNACNLRCRMCSVWGEGVQRDRAIGYISKEVWGGAIEELGSWPVPIGLYVYGAGEPLLHPEFFDIVGAAKRKANISVGFLCNATLFDRDKAKATVELGVDTLSFSVDGAQKDVFEYYRKGAVLERVEENIKFLLAIRTDGKPSVSLRMVNHEEADVQMFVEKWAGHVESITISRKRPVQRETSLPVRLRQPCPLIYRQMIMGWDGTVVLCCEDNWGDAVIGRFPDESLYEIWNGRLLQRARRLHETGRYDEIALCSTCDASHFHLFDEYVAERAGKTTLVQQELPDINPDLGCR
jgi:pyruvate-formate lyase-activating enzyme